MKIFYKISAAVLGMAATIALVQPKIAVGLSDREVGRVAQEITVRIDGPANGSGAIVAQRDNIYTVLTNCHVIETPGTYTIVTHAGRPYRVNANPSMCQPGVDLAMLRFTSTQRYRVANLGNSSRLVVGDRVYASGWVGRDKHNPEKGYRFQPGNITAIQPKAREGYTLVHTNQTEPGMSGGPILDELGNVVGINGRGIQDPNTEEWEFLGIAINIYKSWQAAVIPPKETPINYVIADPLIGHAPPVHSLAFSPDGQLLASSGGMMVGNLIIWNLDSGQLVDSINFGLFKFVTSVAFSPDGKLLACGNTDNKITIWNLGSGKLVRTITGHSKDIRSVAFSPDRKLLASGSNDNTIKIWNLDSGSLVRTLTGHSKDVWSVTFSPDGKLLVSGSNDNTIKIWNLDSGRLVRSLTDHSGSVFSVVISPDGKLLASGSGDNTIKIWNLGSGQLVRTLTGHSKNVNSVAISPDGKLLASGGSDEKVKIWNLDSGRLVNTFTDYSLPVRNIAFSPDGQTIASDGGCDSCTDFFSSEEKEMLMFGAIRIWRGQEQ